VVPQTSIAAKMNTIDRSGFIDDILQLNSCSTREQLYSSLHRLCNKLGFDAFLYGGRFCTDGTRMVEHVESTYSDPWRDRYDKLGYAQVDPTVSHALTSLKPLVWCDDMYVTSAQRAFQEEAYSHGHRAGVTFPIQASEGNVAMLSLSLSSSSQDAQHHIYDTLASGLLTATLAHEAMRAIVKKEQALVRPKLTKREAEVLQWISAGKTTWEISKLLNISEHGVIHHVRNLSLKFDVTSRHQAVVKAIAFGFL
jgi:LuxR family transcriptional regulator, quorum-sensing system regulator LasR